MILLHQLRPILSVSALRKGHCKHYWSTQVSLGTSLPRYSLDIGSLLTYCGGGSAFGADGLHEFDAAVPILVFLPDDISRQPLAGPFFYGKWPAEVFGTVLERSELGFPVGVVICNP